MHTKCIFFNLQMSKISLNQMELVVVNNFRILHHHWLIHYRHRYHQMIDRSQANLSSSLFCIYILTFHWLIVQLDRQESMWSFYKINCLHHNLKRSEKDNLPMIFEIASPSILLGIEKSVEKSV